MDSSSNHSIPPNRFELKSFDTPKSIRAQIIRYPQMDSSSNHSIPPNGFELKSFDTPKWIRAEIIRYPQKQSSTHHSIPQKTKKHTSFYNTNKKIKQHLTLDTKK